LVLRKLLWSLNYHIPTPYNFILRSIILELVWVSDKLLLLSTPIGRTCVARLKCVLVAREQDYYLTSFFTAVGAMSSRLGPNKLWTFQSSCTQAPKRLQCLFFNIKYRDWRQSMAGIVLNDHRLQSWKESFSQGFLNLVLCSSCTWGMDRCNAAAWILYLIAFASHIASVLASATAFATSVLKKVSCTIFHATWLECCPCQPTIQFSPTVRETVEITLLFILCTWVVLKSLCAVTLHDKFWWYLCFMTMAWPHRLALVLDILVWGLLAVLCLLRLASVLPTLTA